MGKLLLVIVTAALSVSVAPAGQSSKQKSEKSTPSGKLLPLKRATSGNSCAAYGAGFVKLEGSDTCVKISGAVGIGVGMSSGAR
jgi:hypothetical protein